MKESEKERKIFEVRDKAYVTLGIMDCKKALKQHDWNVEETLKSIKENPKDYSNILNTL